MAPKQSEKILVVDDDPEAVELMANQVLAPLGYQVATAGEGSAALQIALKMRPDILITSLDLPGFSGRDLLAALRAQGLETTVITLGPRGAEAQALQAFRLGARDYLSKPVREAELVASLDRALGEVRLRRERQQLADKLAATNRQLERRIKELTTLASIGKAVTAVTNLSQLFTRLLEAGMYVTEAEVGWVLVADEADGKLMLRAAKNLPNLSPARLNQPWDDGIGPLLLLSGEGLLLAGPALAKLRAGQVAQATAAVPLKVRDQVLGVIVVGNKTGRPFTERDQAMLSAVADYAAIGLMNARLFQELEARAQKLQHAYDEQVGLARRKDERRLEAAQHWQAAAAQARGGLAQLLQGQTGTLNPRQAESVRAALERLEALQRQLEELAPAAPEGKTRS